GLDVEPADLGHPLVERLSFEQLEHEERAAVLELPGVVDVADVRAADGRRGAGLPEEALDDDGRRGQLLGEDLDGDALADVDVGRLVNGSHASPADLAGDAVLARKDATYGDLRLVRQGHQTPLGVSLCEAVRHDNSAEDPGGSGAGPPVRRAPRRTRGG